MEKKVSKKIPTSGGFREFCDHQYGEVSPYDPAVPPPEYPQRKSTFSRNP
jgi:hypothetical protein